MDINSGIRIVSEPGSFMTQNIKVFSGDTEINGITEIKINADASYEFIIAEIKVLVSHLDIMALPKKEEVCGCCNHTLNRKSKLSNLKDLASTITEHFTDDNFQKNTLAIAKYIEKELKDI